MVFPRQHLVWRIAAACLIYPLALPPGIAQECCGGEEASGQKAAVTFAQEASPTGSALQTPFVPKAPVASTRPAKAQRQAWPWTHNPRDEDFLQVRLFAEPLVPAVTAAGAAAENAALAEALKSYAAQEDKEDTAVLDAFLASHSQSRWEVALRVNLGLLHYQSGRFTRALEMWQAAWAAGKEISEPRVRALAERAFAELCLLNSKLGRKEELEQRFREIEGRQFQGATHELLAHAREGRAVMLASPEISYLCGPMALSRILLSQDGEASRINQVRAAKSTPNGLTLRAVKDLAAQAGMKMQMARRQPGAEWLFPAVVHWKLNHYAALLRGEGERAVVEDPTFRDAFRPKLSTVESEASGCFLVPEGPLPNGWEPIMDAEAEKIWGRGFTSQNDPECTGMRQMQAGGDGGSCGMAHYNLHTMLCSLHLMDTPLRYTPAVGPSVSLQLVYSQRETAQPAVFNYVNIGPKWTVNWLSYVTDNPSNASAAITVYERGGGQIRYPTVVGNQFSGSLYSQEKLTRIISAVEPLISYERTFADGTREIYAAAERGTATSRRIFLTQIIDPSGQALTFSYDELFRLESVTDAVGHQTVLTYGHASDPLKITQVSDPFGRTVTLGYDANGRLISITDPVGIVSQFAYGSGDFINELTTPYGTTRFATASAGTTRWVEATDPNGRTERLEFRHEAPGLTLTDPAGVPAGLAILNDSLIYRNSFYWDKNAWFHHPGDYTKAKIYHWLHTATNNLTAGALENIKVPGEARLWLKYAGQSDTRFQGSSNQPIATARRLSEGVDQIQRLEYNALGKVTREIDPKGREVQHLYFANGIDLQEIRRIKPGGHDTLASFTYHPGTHLVHQSTDAAGQTTTYLYNNKAQISSITNPLSEVTTFHYHPSHHHLSSIDGPLPGTADSHHFTFDEAGRLTSVTDSEGYTLAWAYDALDRPLSVTYPDSTSIQWVYLENSGAKRLEPVWIKDRKGRWTRHVYDGARQLRATVDPLARVTQFDYCGCGHMKKLIDPNGNTTLWEYDEAGRLLRKRYADALGDTFTYDVFGRPRTETDAKGQMTTFGYDIDDALISVTYSNEQQPTADVTWQYDPVYPRVVRMDDGLGATHYGYHPVAALGANQLASEDGPFANDTLQYAYDALGRATRREINGAANRIDWHYDALGRIDQETNNLGIFTFGYVNHTSRPAQVNFPGDAIICGYGYHPNSGDQRLQEIHYRRGSDSSTLNKFNYTYDAAGNILSWRQQAAAAVQTYLCEYDAGDQLAAATLIGADNPANVLKASVWRYDPAGNRLSEQVDNSIASWTHNNLNQITARQAGGPLRVRGQLDEAATVTLNGQPARVNADHTFEGFVQTPPGASTLTIAARDRSPQQNLRTTSYQINTTSPAAGTYAHDPNGNRTGDPTRTYEWDAKDRLIAINQGTHRSEFAYDGRDRLTLITERENGAIVSQSRQVWSGTKVAEIRDGTGTPIAMGYGKGEYHPADGSKHFFAEDHLGSTHAVLDSAGTAVARFSFDLWGQRHTLLGQPVDFCKFAGLRQHKESASWMAFYRFLDSATAQWLSRDIVTADGGDFRLQGYVRNNPMARIDTTGLLSTGATAAFDWGIIGGEVGGAVGGELAGGLDSLLEELLGDPDFDPDPRSGLKKALEESLKESEKQKERRDVTPDPLEDEEKLDGLTSILFKDIYIPGSIALEVLAEQSSTPWVWRDDCDRWYDRDDSSRWYNRDDGDRWYNR